MEDKSDENILTPLILNPKEINQTLLKEKIQCLNCDLQYEFPYEQHDYLGHLFMEHRLVIADVNEIGSLEDYLKFWQKELKGKHLEEFCTTLLLDQKPDGSPAKNEKYYLLSDILPKDYELRTQLKKKRLERALAVHQFERTDRTFSKECLYCRDVITGLRGDFISHLYNKHFLLLGKPEKLVFIDELLVKLEKNMEKLICLYCEKVFKDRSILKEHMRKKGHKRINQDNHDYDKFFLENYKNDLPPLNTNKKLHKHKPRNKQKSSNPNPNDNEPPTLDIQEPKTLPEQEETCEENASIDFEQRFEDSDSDWSDWGEDGLVSLICLFCKHEDKDFAKLKEHLLKQHHVDLDEHFKDLNFYQRIKIINYVRRQMCVLRCVTCNLRCDNLELLQQHLQQESHYGLGIAKQWDKPEYFFPTYEDDGLLCILDDSPNDDLDDTVVRIISEDSKVKINKDAEQLSLEGFKFSL